MVHDITTREESLKIIFIICAILFCKLFRSTIYDFFNFFTVKYLREVTPYFKKSSPLNELGWGSHPDPPKETVKTSNWSETKTIPLKMCYLCRNLSISDLEQKVLELHSPDGKSSCILRFSDPLTASDWFNAIHSNVTMLTQQAISEANQITISAPNQGEIMHMGWLSEQVMIMMMMIFLVICRAWMTCIFTS